jgi:hypothetical protein
MGRPPIDRRKGAMTATERQQRRRKLLRHDIEVDGLVEHVRRVLHEATATEKSALLKELVPLIRMHEQDMKALDRFWKRRLREP